MSPASGQSVKLKGSIICTKWLSHGLERNGWLVGPAGVVSSVVAYSLIDYRSEAETPCQKWGGSVFMKFTIYIHSEILHSPFDLLTTKFWGGSAPLIKK